MKSISYPDIAIGVASFILLLLGLFAWLFFNAEGTITERQTHLKPVKAVVTLARPEEPEQTETLADDDKTAEAPSGEKVIPAPEIKEEQPVSITETKSQAPVPVEPVQTEALQETVTTQSQWKKYAQPVNVAKDTPKIALIVDGLGQKATTLQSLLKTLPQQATLSFLPYSQNTGTLMTEAHQAGFELLLQIPMEPIGFPDINPGPKTLMVNAARTQNLSHLEWVLKQGKSYVGTINLMGSAFILDEHALTPVLSDLFDKNVIFVDGLAGTGRSVAAQITKRTGAPYVPVDLKVDEILSETEIDKQLRALEIIAKEFGYAVGVISPYPLSLSKITTWAKTLDKSNIALVPISTVYQTTQEKP